MLNGTGKSMIVHHQVIKISHTGISTWISGRKDSSNRIFLYLCQLPNCFRGGQYFLLHSLSLPSSYLLHLKKHVKENMHTDVQPSSKPEARLQKGSAEVCWDSFWGPDIWPKVLGGGSGMACQPKLKKPREGKDLWKWNLRWHLQVLDFFF